MALINQKTGSAQGIPGLTLYKLAAQQPTAFHDVPAGSTVAVPCVTGSPNCTTTRTGDAYGILSGYDTATGYDLATGLGSVDAANLVNQWHTVSFTPSTTTLSVNAGAAVSITHGAPVPLSINVTPSAATGDAALMVAPATPGNPGIAAFPLTSGSVATSTALLPGGNYSVLAHYGGDSTYGGSYSNSVPVNVSPETSIAFANLVTTDVHGVTTSFSASSATYGSGYQFFRVDVGDANASVSPSTGITSLCASRKESCPTGIVALTAPGTALDGTTLQLNSEGYAQAPLPSAGAYSITATYHGDASFGSSTTTGTFTVAKAPTTVSAAVAGQPVEYGNSEQIGAWLLTTSDGVAPTGTFQFSVDGNPVPVGPLTTFQGYPYGGVPNGTPFYATATGGASTAFPGIGNHTLSAQYSGDANYAAGVSPSASISVVQATPRFLDYGVASPWYSVIAGQSTTATASLYGSDHGVAPTGAVTFYDNKVALPGTVTYTRLSAPGILNASMPAVFSTPGTHQITVSYSGDANYTSTMTSYSSSLLVLGPVTVTPTGGITIASPGQSGSTKVIVIPNGGFSGPASITCAPDPNAKEATCSLTSGSSSGSTVQVNLTGLSVDVTLNVATTAAHQLARQETSYFGASSKLAMAGMIGLFLPLFKRQRKYFLCFIALVLTLNLGACSGGGSTGSGGGSVNTDPGTAAGTYSFIVTASTGSGTNIATVGTAVVVTVN